MLESEFLEEIQYVKDNGIGWIQGHPCVADWYVPYKIPHKIFVEGYDDFGVGPMRGSQLNIHLMAIANGDKRQYAGDYYFAYKLAKRFASTIKNKKQMTLSFKVNKNHPFFSFLQKQEPHGKCWDGIFESTVMHALIDGVSPEMKQKFMRECKIVQSPIYYAKTGHLVPFYGNNPEIEQMVYEFSIVQRRFSHMDPKEFFET